MAKVINIRRDVEDQFYRYKMPSLICKVEGRGNGIKTVLVNMGDVAKALARPPAYPSKCTAKLTHQRLHADQMHKATYSNAQISPLIKSNQSLVFGGELGTQVKIDEKKNHFVINGKHDSMELQNLLDVFIDKFVLCQSCKNPETEFEFTKDDMILKDCKACGIHSNVDMRHKLSSYILKNRPEVDKNDKYRKNNDRAAAAAGSADNSGGEEEDGLPVDEQFVKDLNALPTAEERRVDDDDWAVDTSAEAAAARLQELSVKLPGEEEEEELKDSVEEFADYLTAVSDFDDADIIAKAAELLVREDKAITVLVQVMLNANVLLEKQIETHQSLFRHFASTSQKAQKGLLGGIERLVIVSFPALLPSVSLILKALYDCDLVDEEVFLAWDEKTSKKYVDKKDAKRVREKAAPFINWLREAEEEEDDD